MDSAATLYKRKRFSSGTHAQATAATDPKLRTIYKAPACSQILGTPATHTPQLDDKARSMASSRITPLYDAGRISAAWKLKSQHASTIHQGCDAEDGSLLGSLGVLDTSFRGAMLFFS